MPTNLLEQTAVKNNDRKKTPETTDINGLDSDPAESWKDGEDKANKKETLDDDGEPDYLTAD